MKKCILQKLLRKEHRQKISQADIRNTLCGFRKKKKAASLPTAAISLDLFYDSYTQYPFDLLDL